MDKVLDALADIKAAQQTTAEAAKQAQDAVDSGLANMGESVKAAADQAASALQQIQDSNSSIKAIQDTAKHLETAMARMGNGSGEAKELEAKAHDEMCRYLRHGDAMNEEVVGEVAKSLIAASFHGLTDAEQEFQMKSLVAGINPDGGYFIRPERSAQMIQRIFETSPLRQFANVVTTSSDSLEMIIDDDEADSGGWVGETSQRNETGTPQVGVLTIPVHEQFAQPLATQKMIDDAGFDIESWLTNKVTSKMTRVENSAFLVGDGSQKPKGFLAYPAWANAGEYQRDALEQIGSLNAGGVTGDDFKAMQVSLIEEYQNGAVWGMKRASFYDIITLKDDDGNYIFQSHFLKERDDMRLLGKQIAFMNDMPEIANNALPVAYGNFGVGYTIVDRMGFRVVRDIYTSKPYTKFYTTKRAGGAVTNYEAIKLLKIKAS